MNTFNVIVTDFEMLEVGRWGTALIERTSFTKHGTPDMRTRNGKTCARYIERAFRLSEDRYNRGIV